jgi:hypothetical protein
MITIDIHSNVLHSYTMNVIDGTMLETRIIRIDLCVFSCCDRMNSTNDNRCLISFFFDHSYQVSLSIERTDVER